MEDGADAVLTQQLRDQRAVGDIAADIGCLLRHEGASPVAFIVDDRHVPAGVEQREHGVAADVAGATGDEDRDFGDGHGRSSTIDERRR